jgi:predicted PurR-regulated permease PerM
MPGRNDPRLFLLLLAALAAWLTWQLVAPFAAVLFLAAVLAVALAPLHGWVTRRLGGHRSLAAGVVTLAVLLALAGPVAGLATVVVGQALEGLKWLPAVLDERGLAELVGRLPEVVQPSARELLARVPHGADEIREAITGTLGGQAVSSVGGLLQATGTAVTRFVLFFLALFFLLADGSAFVDWLQKMLPLPAGRAPALLKYLRGVTVSVIVSTLATAGIQAVLALVGYAIAGVPSPLFFGALTFFTALIPAVGTALVFVPLALLRLATGHTASAVFLLAWGVVVVGMVDNVVKPLLIRRGVDFPTGVVFFALLGGLAAFGPVGLVAGPLSVALLVAALQALGEDRR